MKTLENIHIYRVVDTLFLYNIYQPHKCIKCYNDLVIIVFRAGKNSCRCKKTSKKYFFYVIHGITSLSKIINLNCNPLKLGANRLTLSCVARNFTVKGTAIANTN